LANVRHKQPFHNRSFGESQKNQPIADDQSMLRRLFPARPISDSFCRIAEALRHSMAIMLEKEVSFSDIPGPVNVKPDREPRNHAPKFLERATIAPRSDDEDFDD
jgi:hypothetical protein